MSARPIPPGSFRQVCPGVVCLEGCQQKGFSQQPEAGEADWGEFITHEIAQCGHCAAVDKSKHFAPRESQAVAEVIFRRSAAK